MRWSLIALTVAAAACGSDPEPPDPAPAFGEPPAGISVFEASYDGFATRGARAALAEPAAEPEIEVGREGSCRLLTFENGSCDPPCDGPCVDGACPAPALHGAGTIAVAGLAVPLTLTPTDGVYQQDQTGLPDDLFADDAEVTATAAGDDWAGFELTTTAVPTIVPDLEQDQITLLDGADTVVTWSPVSAGARVRLQLRSTSESATLPAFARIECEGPDTGVLTIPAALTAGFPKMVRMNLCPDPYCPPSTIIRYRRAALATADAEITLTVASEISFAIEH